MIEITKENYKDIDFNGVIISVPREHLKNELTQDFSLHFECAYYTKGEHGYKTSGHNPDRSSFFIIWYGDEDMPNGFGFNSTSRLPWDEKYLHFNNVRYYKFKDMSEFCEWYLQQKGCRIQCKSDSWQWKTVESVEPKDLLTKLQQDPGYFKPTEVEKYQPQHGYIVREGYEKKGGINPPPKYPRPEPPKGQNPPIFPPEFYFDPILEFYKKGDGSCNNLESPNHIMNKKQIDERMFPGHEKRCNQFYMKEIQHYIQTAMNIQYYNHFKVFEPNASFEEIKQAEEKAKELREHLLDWLNEEVK